MSPEIAITLVSLLVALVLFGTEKLPVDVVGIILVIGLVLTGVLTVNEGVSGFGDNVIITIAGLFVLTGGLIKTGLVDLIGRRLYRIAGEQRIFADGFDNVRRGGFRLRFEKYDDDGDVRSGRFGFGKSRENSSFKTADAARVRRDFRRKLHTDRNVNKSRRQRRDAALRNGAVFDV